MFPIIGVAGEHIVTEWHPYSKCLNPTLDHRLKIKVIIGPSGTKKSSGTTII